MLLQDFGVVFVIKSRALWRIWGRFAAEILSSRLLFPMGKEVILPCSRWWEAIIHASACSSEHL